jgi:hypothetical protein
MIQSNFNDLNYIPELLWVATGEGVDSEHKTWEGIPCRCGEHQGDLQCQGPERHTFKVYARCDRQDCPTCWGSWMQREEESITDRLGWARKQLPGVPFSHYIVSFAHFPESKRDYRAMRAQAVQKCKRLGLIGGVMVPHLHPKNNYLHFHVAGFGLLDIANVSDDYQENGIIIKLIRRIDSISKLSDYELDHALKVDGCQTVTWWGNVSTRAISVVETHTEKDDECSICHSKLLEIREINHYDGGREVNPVHKIYVVTRQYAFR